MIRKVLWMLGVTSSLLLGGCTNEMSDVPEDKTPLNLTAHINSVSRAPQMGEDGSGRFEEGDVMGVAIAGDDGQFLTLDFPYASRMFWEDIPLNEGADKVGFVGYYPLLEVGKGEQAVTFDVTEAKEKDLLLAAREEVNYLSQEHILLGFTHAMHRLDVKFTSSDATYSEEELKSIITVCNAYAGCTVDLKKGEIHTPADKKDYPSLTGSKEISVYLVPQEKADVTLKLDIAGKHRELSLAGIDIDGMSDTALQGGKVLTIKLDVRRNGIFINGADISGWENQGSAEGEIEL